MCSVNDQSALDLHFIKTILENSHFYAPLHNIDRHKCQQNTFLNE